jgi:hypothetical protein
MAIVVLIPIIVILQDVALYALLEEEHIILLGGLSCVMEVW